MIMRGNSKEKGGTKTVLANTGRWRVNIIGGSDSSLSLQTTVLLTEGSCDKEVMKSFLKRVRQDYPRREGAVFLSVQDKERYQTRSNVERFFGRIKKNKKLALRFDKIDLSSFASFDLALLKRSM